MRTKLAVAKSDRMMLERLPEPEASVIRIFNSKQ
jgi:hypothetical protein